MKNNELGIESSDVMELMLDAVLCRGSLGYFVFVSAAFGNHVWLLKQVSIGKQDVEFCV